MAETVYVLQMKTKCDILYISQTIACGYYTHGKKLGNTSCLTRVNFGLRFFYVLIKFKQNCSVNLNL